jgi:hypothetical protein
VTAVEHMEDDDRSLGKTLSADSPHVLEPSHGAPEHACPPNADPVADCPSLLKTPSPG